MFKLTTYFLATSLLISTTSCNYDRTPNTESLDYNTSSPSLDENNKLKPKVEEEAKNQKESITQPTSKPVIIAPKLESKTTTSNKPNTNSKQPEIISDDSEDNGNEGNIHVFYGSDGKDKNLRVLSDMTKDYDFMLSDLEAYNTKVMDDIDSKLHLLKQSLVDGKISRNEYDATGKGLLKIVLLEYKSKTDKMTKEYLRRIEDYKVRSESFSPSEKYQFQKISLASSKRAYKMAARSKSKFLELAAKYK